MRAFIPVYREVSYWMSLMMKSFGHIQIPMKRIHLELTNVCNLNCVFCPKSVMTRPAGFIDTELAKKAIKEIAENGLCEKITFHVMGEPTLHPDFFEILDYAALRGLEVGLTTNGTALAGRTGKRLLDYELHQVDVSLQTPDEKSFALRKAGTLTFGRYLDGIMEFFSAYHHRYPKSIFKFRLMNTAMKSNSGDAGQISVISSTAELRNIVERYSRTIYRLLGLPFPDSAPFESKLKSLVHYKWNVIEVLPNVFFETYLLSGWGNAFDDNVTPLSRGYCYGMRDHFGILYNGDVVLCCIDYDGKTKIGNIGDSSITDILSSDMLGEIVDGFNGFRLVHPYCRHCQGSKSGLGRVVKPVAAVLGLKVLKPFFYKHTRLFE